MDLRLPALPDLQPPNLLSAGAATANASVIGQVSPPQDSLPPYLQKLLQLQQLQDKALASTPCPPVQGAPVLVNANSGAHRQQIASVSLNMAAEISGAELAPMLTPYFSQDQHPSASHTHQHPSHPSPSFTFAASISASFLEVDEQ